MPEPIVASQANYYGPLSNRNPNMSGPVGSAQKFASDPSRYPNSYNNSGTYNSLSGTYTNTDFHNNFHGTNTNNYTHAPQSQGYYSNQNSMPMGSGPTQYATVDSSAYVGAYSGPTSQPPNMLGGVPSSSSMPVVVVPSVSADATTPLPPTHTRVVPSRSSQSSHHRHHHSKRKQVRERIGERSNTIAQPEYGVSNGSMSSPPVPGVLRVHVHRGEGFKSTHALTRAAPYVVLTLGSHARKTRYVKTTNGAAHWDEQLELDVSDARVEWLQVRVQDRHRMHADGVVGRRAELPLQRLCYGQLHPADADTTEGRVVLTLVLLPPGQGYGKGGSARKMPNLTRRGRTKKRDGKRFRGGDRAPSPVSSDDFSYSDRDGEDSEDIEREAYYRQNMTNPTNTVAMHSTLAR